MKACYILKETKGKKRYNLNCSDNLVFTNLGRFVTTNSVSPKQTISTFLFSLSLFLSIFITKAGFW